MIACNYFLQLHDTFLWERKAVEQKKQTQEGCRCFSSFSSSIHTKPLAPQQHSSLCMHSTYPLAIQPWVTSLLQDGDSLSAGVSVGWNYWVCTFCKWNIHQSSEATPLWLGPFVFAIAFVVAVPRAGEVFLVEGNDELRTLYVGLPCRHQVHLIAVLPASQKESFSQIIRLAFSHIAKRSISLEQSMLFGQVV